MLTLPSKADTITQDFNSLPTNFPTGLPEGWSIVNSGNGYISKGWSGGIDNSMCIGLSTYPGETYEAAPATFVTEAKAGTVSIMAKPSGSYAATASNGYITIYKMIPDGSGSYSYGEVLVKYTPLNTMPGYTTYTDYCKVEVTVAEDCYVGFAGNNCNIDNYVNEYNTGGGGGGETGDPTIVDFNDWPSIPSTNADQSGTLDNGWSYINNLYGMGISVANGIGVDGTKGIYFQYNGEGNPAIITAAKAGQVSIQVKIHDNQTPSDKSCFFAYYKMEKAADGSFSFGEELKKVSPLNTLPGYTSKSEWYTVTIDITEDMYIGISGFGCIVDNYENIPSGDQPGPVDEWETASSQNFNTVGANSGSNRLNVATLPEGWYAFGKVTSNAQAMAWPSTAGVDNTACIFYNISSYTNSDMSYLVTYVKAGKVSFMIKPMSSSFIEDETNTRGWLAVHNMTGEPGSFALGNIIADYNSLAKVKTDDVITVNPALSTTAFSKVEFTVEKDGWIGISLNKCYFDNFENLTKAGGDTPQPTTITVEEDFDPKGAQSGDYKIVTSELPTGWYGGGCLNEASTYNAGWSATQGVDGSACIKMDPTMMATGKPYLVTYAHKGKISIEAKVTNAAYLDNTETYFGFYKATGEPGSFGLGDAIVSYSPVGQITGLNADGFVTIEAEMPEDGYLAICANKLYLDNFRNTYEQAVTATYTVSGIVSNESGNPVAGATVALTGTEGATTGEDGSFTIANVPESTGLNLSVTAEDYETYNETLDVASDQTLNITLKAVKSVMVVTASDYMVNITTPVFTLYDGETAIAEGVAANEEGKYVFTIEGALNPQGYTLKAEAPYFENYSSPVKVNDRYTSYPRFIYGETVNCTAYFNARQLSLTVTVTDDNQEYVTDATLTLAYPEGSTQTYNRYPTNNNDGTYTFTNVKASVAADKECTVTCSVPDMKPIENQTVIFNDADQTLQFTAEHYAPTTISGTVTDLMGQPVTDAMVVLFEGTTMEEGYQEAAVDAEGHFSFTVERYDCSYMLVAGAENYEDVEPYIIEKIEREDQLTHDFVLEKIMFTFTATVKDKDGEAISGAAVTLNGESLGMDENGNFFTAIWAGDAQQVDKYVAIASAEGYIDQEFEFDLYEDEHVTKDFVLEPVPVYTIAGQLLDAETKEPIAAEFAMLLVNGELSQSQMTDAEGRFSFTVDDASATYGLMGNALGYDAMDEANPIPVPELIPNGTVTVNIELQPTYYTITVNVKDEQGAPLTDATVTLTNAEGAELATENKGDGTYTYAAPEKKMTFGQYTLTVACDGYQPYSQDFDVAMYNYEVNVDATIIKNGIASLFAGQQGAVNANGKIYVLGNVRIFSVNGMVIRTISAQEPVEVELEPGIYIVEGRKMIVK